HIFVEFCCCWQPPPSLPIVHQDNTSRRLASGWKLWTGRHKSSFVVTTLRRPPPILERPRASPQKTSPASSYFCNRPHQPWREMIYSAPPPHSKKQTGTSPGMPFHWRCSPK